MLKSSENIDYFTNKNNSTFIIIIIRQWFFISLMTFRYNGHKKITFINDLKLSNFQRMQTQVKSIDILPILLVWRFLSNTNYTFIRTKHLLKESFSSNWCRLLLFDDKIMLIRDLSMLIYVSDVFSVLIKFLFYINSIGKVYLECVQIQHITIECDRMRASQYHLYMSEIMSSSRSGTF